MLKFKIEQVVSLDTQAVADKIESELRAAGYDSFFYLRYLFYWTKRVLELIDFFYFNTSYEVNTIEPGFHEVGHNLGLNQPGRNLL